MTALNRPEPVDGAEVRRAMSGRRRPTPILNHPGFRAHVPCREGWCSRAAGAVRGAGTGKASQRHGAGSPARNLDGTPMRCWCAEALNAQVGDPGDCEGVTGPGNDHSQASFRNAAARATAKGGTGSPQPLKRSGALKSRRKEWIPGPGETRAARCCVVAWCWSACGLLARPARRSLEAAEERVQASGEPFVAVVCPHVLAQGGQRREPVGWQ